MISLGAVAGLTPFGLTKAAASFAPARVGGGFFGLLYGKPLGFVLVVFCVLDCIIEASTTQRKRT